MSIPLVDLKWQHAQVEQEVRRGFDDVLERTAFVLGPAVSAFEEAYAEFSEAKHCVGVGNGTDALELLARAADIGQGDEVILPANTFIATALGVARAGATPVLVDSDPVHHLIDVDQVKQRIGARTKAIMPVHLYGQCAPIDLLEPLARDAGVPILEDAAQSQGARRHGRPSGVLGLGSATSFYPGKNLGAYGDAGAVVTDDEALAERVRKLRNYGSDVKYHHPETGFNSRLDTIQAVVLCAKLKRLRHWNELRQKAAARYEDLLDGVPGLTLPSTLPGNEHVWHLYVVRVRDRDRVLEALGEAGVGAGIHYPVPIHLQGAFAHLGHQRGDFPVAELAASEILSLPLFPGITEAQQIEVARALRGALGG